VQVTFAPAAEQDLEDIGDYIARDSPLRAATFIHEIREHCRSIASAPRAAPLWPELAGNLRMVPHGRYLIFYSLFDEMVRIERVLHGARDRRGLS
jgi:toxin ParE1/3/4